MDFLEDMLAETGAGLAEAGAGAAEATGSGRSRRGRGRGSGRSRSRGRGRGRGSGRSRSRVDEVAKAENKAWSQQMHKQKQRVQMLRRSLKQTEVMQKLAEESGGVHRRCKVSIKKESTQRGRKSRALAYGIRIKFRRKGQSQRTGGCFALSWSAMCELAFNKDKSQATMGNDKLHFNKWFN